MQEITKVTVIGIKEFKIDNFISENEIWQKQKWGRSCILCYAGFMF